MNWDASIVVALNRFVVDHHLAVLVHVLGVELTYVFPLAIVFFWFRRSDVHRRAAFAAAVALMLGAALYFTTNHLFQRPRPDIGLPGQVHTLIATGSIDESAFPSGHATAGFAVAVALGFLETPWLMVLLAVAVLNTTGRIAAGVHYPTDVIAGAALGTLVAVIVVLNRRMLDRPYRVLSNLSNRILPALPHPPA